MVFFHFGPGAAGGVQANVQRWLGQFKEPADKLKAQITDETIDDIKGGVKINIEQKQRHHGSNAEDYQRQYTHQEVHGRTHHVEDV